MSFENVPNFLGNFSVAEMTVDEHRIFRFNSFSLDTTERKLERGGDAIPLTPKAFDTLVFLVRNAGHLVTKDELMSAVWPDSFVDEGNIPRTVHTLRKALGEDGGGNKFIETVPTRGYRFVAEVVDGVGSVSNDDTSVESGAQIAPAKELPAGYIPRRRGFIVPLIGLVAVLFVSGFLISGEAFFPSPGKANASKHSDNGEAYRHFQEGRTLVEDWRRESYERALEHFEKAIELDPNYAAAHAGKADAKSFQFIGTNGHDDILTAKAALEKALEIDPNSAYARTVQCRITGTYEWEFDRAVDECRRAVALDPGDGQAHRELALALNVVGQTDESLREIEAAIALSPTSFNKRTRAGLLYMARRFDEAIAELEHVEGTDPNRTDAERWLMLCYVAKGDTVNAVDHLIKLQEANGLEAEGTEAIRAAFKSGGWASSLRVTLDSPSGIAKKKSVLIAGLLAQIGETERAFEILNDMHKRRAIMMITVAREPLLDPIREDPRYAVILSQMKLK